MSRPAPYRDPIEAALCRLAVAHVMDAGGLWVDPKYEVGVAVGEAGALVGWLDVEWSTPATPVWCLRDAVHVPRGLDLPREALERRLTEALVGAARAREAGVLRCVVCGAPTVPGHLYDDRVCQGCAERRFGVCH